MNVKFKKAGLLLADFVLFLVIFLLIFYLFFEKKFDNKNYPNVYLNGFSLGSLTVDELKLLLARK